MRRTIAVTMVMVAMTIGLSGCAGEGPSFDPTGPCVADGSVPGAYPELESRIPKIYRGTSPERLDSGRNCSAERLGSLRDAGYQEVRFAGGTWSFGAERALAIVVFTAPGLTAGQIAEFYEQGARANGRTEVLARADPTIAGRPGWRLDTKTGERLQTVVVWPAADEDVVNVVITNDLPDARIDEAIAAFGDG
jgi:hypothetical protein